MPTPITKIPQELKTKELVEEDVSRLPEIIEQLESCRSGKESFVLLSSDDPGIEVVCKSGKVRIGFDGILLEGHLSGDEIKISRGPFGDLND